MQGVNSVAQLFFEILCTNAQITDYYPVYLSVWMKICIAYPTHCPVPSYPSPHSLHPPVFCFFFMIKLNVRVV